MRYIYIYTYNIYSSNNIYYMKVVKFLKLGKHSLKNHVGIGY